MTEDVTGVKCGFCGEETFRVVEREVTIVAKVCPRCARVVDMKSEEKDFKDQLAAMDKFERKRALKEKSFEWAENLHGKKVIVFWEDNTHPTFCSPKSKYQAQGIAYRTTNECGGWGNVKVVIDPAEYHRISLQWAYSIEYGTGKHLPYQKPIIDGQEYGLYLNLNGDGSYYTLVSWGCRKALIEEEVIRVT